MKKPYKLVMIKWEDSGTGYQGWKDISTANKTLSPCVSVGFLVYEDKKVKVLFPHLDGSPNQDNLHGAGDMTIPKSAILKEIKLKQK